MGRMATDFTNNFLLFSFHFQLQARHRWIGPSVARRGFPAVVFRHQFSHWAWHSHHHRSNCLLRSSKNMAAHVRIFPRRCNNTFAGVHDSQCNSDDPHTAIGRAQNACHELRARRIPNAMVVGRQHGESWPIGLLPRLLAGLHTSWTTHGTIVPVPRAIAIAFRLST